MEGLYRPVVSPEIRATIPEFPDFAPIDFPLRAEIERLTASQPTHGDFHFTSLWAWDLAGPSPLATPTTLVTSAQAGAQPNRACAARLGPGVRRGDDGAGGGGSKTPR